MTLTAKGNAAARTIPSLLCLAAGIACAQNFQVSTVVGGIPPLGPMPATDVAVGHVTGVATDRAGNVYLSSSRGCVFQVDTAGSLRRVAGTCRADFSGDGGPATAAQLNFPRGLALDTNGNLFIADDSGCRVRKVAKDGAITTVAGTGECYLSADDGVPATKAILNYPQAIAVDTGGSIYVAESNRVRKFSPGGPIATVVSGVSGSLALDSAGSLFIASGSQIFKARGDGGVTTVAGKANTIGDTGNGGPALNAAFASFIGLAFNAGGDLVVADGTVRRISPDGIVHAVAGAACCDVAGQNRAWAGGVASVAVDALGNTYVGVVLGDVVRKITPAGAVTDVAGNVNPGYVGDGGPATEAQLFNPQDVAVDAAGNLYIADYGNSRVRKVSPSGVTTSIAGNGTAGFSGDGGPATSARPAGPVALALDSAGNLFISEYLNNRVRKVTPDGIIRTVAGTGCCELGDGGPATQAYIPMPHGIAVDSLGNLYIAEWPDSRIRRVTPDGIISTIAGTGTRGFSGDGGPSTDAQLNCPWGIAVDSQGNIFIADNGLRKISPDGIITSIVGIPSSSGIALDSAGNVFTSSGWKVSPAGKVSALRYYTADGQQVFASGIGITVDSHGNLFMVSGNQVRKLEPLATPVSIDAVTNSASGLASALAPGEMVTIYVEGFGPPALTVSQPGNTGLPTTLAGTQVFFNGIAAPIVYTSSTQICAIVPYGVGNGVIGVISGTPYPDPVSPSVSVAVDFQGSRSSSTSLALAASSPGVFTLSSNGRGPAVAYNEDGSLNGAASPARPGSVITFYATGEGHTNPPGVDGQLGAATPPQPVAKVNVSIGGKSATVRYAGGVTGQVAGLMHVKVQVPDGIPAAGSVPLILTVGDSPSQAGVTVSLAGN